MACTTEMDCPGCHECLRGACVPVEANTDPIGECPILCNVKLVCSNKQVCVYQHAPECNCNWLTGNCMMDATTTTKTILPSTSSPSTVSMVIEVKREDHLLLEERQLQALGYSDADIRMFIELFRSEMDYHHREYETVTPSSLLTSKEKEEDKEATLDYLQVLATIQEAVPALTLILLALAILYFRRHASNSPSPSLPETPIKKIV